MECRTGALGLGKDPEPGAEQAWTQCPGAGPATKTRDGRMASASVSYQRTREMTIDELLLENRIVFLIGEINHASLPA
jgi:hypothetical protein